MPPGQCRCRCIGFVITPDNRRLRSRATARLRCLSRRAFPRTSRITPPQASRQLAMSQLLERPERKRCTFRPTWFRKKPAAIRSAPLSHSACRSEGGQDHPSSTAKRVSRIFFDRSVGSRLRRLWCPLPLFAGARSGGRIFPPVSRSKPAPCATTGTHPVLPTNCSKNLYIGGSGKRKMAGGEGGGAWDR